MQRHYPLEAKKTKSKKNPADGENERELADKIRKQAEEKFEETEKEKWHVFAGMTNYLIEQQWNSSYVIEKQDKMYDTMTKQLGVVVLDDCTGKLKQMWLKRLCAETPTQPNQVCLPKPSQISNYTEYLEQINIPWISSDKLVPYSVRMNNLWQNTHYTKVDEHEWRSILPPTPHGTYCAVCQA